MKKTLIIIAALCMATGLYANEKYMRKMGETLKQMAAATDQASLQEAANTFHTIGEAEANEWLPYYWEANCYISMGFMEDLSFDDRDNYLARAEKILDRLGEKVPGESEIFALKALCLTGSMVLDPASRAMQLSPQIGAAIGRSLSLDADNPRAKYLRLANDRGTARFFGNDLSPFCDQAKELLESWDEYALRSLIHPNWGKDLTAQIANACKE